MRRVLFMFCGLLLFCVGSMQAQENFNPDSPTDPQVPVFYYPVTVTCEPAGAGSGSGDGSYYVPGETITVGTSPNDGYIFNHWELNGALYEATTTSFDYMTVAGKMDFVAVYEFVPLDPNEPTMDAKSRLYLTSDPADVCTFNRTSGERVDADQYVYVDIIGVDQLYEFTGWWLNGTKLTEERAFNHLMGYHDETLVAHFRVLPFNPDSPSDPQKSAYQTEVQTHANGDANEDYVVDVTDVVAVINAYLTSDSSAVNSGLADANGDGVIDISDAVFIINLYLNQ